MRDIRFAARVAVVTGEAEARVVAGVTVDPAAAAGIGGVARAVERDVTTNSQGSAPSRCSQLVEKVSHALSFASSRVPTRPKGRRLDSRLREVFVDTSSPQCMLVSKPLRAESAELVRAQYFPWRRP